MLDSGAHPAVTAKSGWIVGQAWREHARIILLAIGMLVLLSFSSGAIAASDADVRWNAEIVASFPPDRVQLLGGEQGLTAFQNAFSSRLKSAGIQSEWKPQAAATPGKQFALGLSGTGLTQLKQVAFSELQPFGGLLGGPISLSLQGSVKGGETIGVSLETNSSTGFQWEIRQLDSSVLRPVGQAAVSPKTNLLGAPEKETLRVQALKDASASLTLSYRRPWAGDVQPTRRLSIQAPRLLTLADLTDPTPPQRRPELPSRSGSSTLSAGATLPAVFDWRSQLTPIRDQGGCGSCWAFGTVGPFEANLRIKDSLTTDLSEQFLVSCNTEPSKWGCGGGWWAHDYHENRLGARQTQVGAVPESAFPYTASDTPCGGAYSHPYKLDGWAYIGNDYSVPPEDQIKQAIMNYGPVGAAICVGTAFAQYSGGVFHPAPSQDCTGVNHAIVLVGWDDTTSPPSWILRNSWGTGWGIGGYMYIARDVSNVGYSANYVVYAGARPANDSFADATVIAGSSYSMTEDTQKATTVVDDPSYVCTSSQGSHSVWWKFIPSTSGRLSLNTIGSNYDTVLALWTGSQGHLASVGCDDNSGGSSTSRLSLNLTGGTAYYIEVADRGSTGGTLKLNLTYDNSNPAFNKYLPFLHR